MFAFYFILKNDPSYQDGVYRIETEDKIFYTKGYEEIPNGIEFIELRHNSEVKVFGNFSIEKPKRK